ncbi:MAG: potassium transporter Kup [Actinobacteria bacterium]|nr:potassium transporter Kup [Actinomycetota bacterium]
MDRVPPAKVGVGGAALVVGALGVVFGDIGTSPLYSLRETFEHHGIPVDRPNVMGACSLVLWSLILVVTVKYVLFILRADNHGEGGILALTALVVGDRARQKVTGTMAVLLLLGLFGMALLYGDGVITPAITVLSATEGLQVALPSLSAWVLPLAVVILIALFAIQHRGTGVVGKLFGPVMLVWFITLGVLGISQAVGEPSIFTAINPAYAVSYLTSNGIDGFLSLGSVFLVVTGGEALYADLGHFGRLPIQRAWFLIGFPALVLNYFGQCAMLLSHPAAIANPVFLMAPQWFRWPLVVLATCAAVIASQALISGAFSMTVQAMRLDYLPRMTVRHTSASHVGQVYLPLVNWLLAAGCIGLVLVFQESSGLAAAYGIAVTATMFVTTLLFYKLCRLNWGWSMLRAMALCLPLGVLEFGFFGANVFKIPSGGWFPLLVGTVIIIAMTTWRTGRRVVAERLEVGRVPIRDFIARLPEDIARAPGTAVFMFRGDGVAPPSLLANTKHNKVLHRRVILLSVVTATDPYVPESDRVEIQEFGRGLCQITLHHGFMEELDVPAAIDGLEIGGSRLDVGEVTFFLGRETVIPSELVTMAPWRERLFAFMLRAAASASRFFKLPPEQVVEVGSQVEI